MKITDKNWKRYETGYSGSNLFFPGCYQEEIKTEWCADHYHVKNICDGSKKDCLAKGEAKCSADNACYGVMYHPGGWSNNNKGVKFCTSTKLTPKGDWQAFLKCPGNYF